MSGQKSLLGSIFTSIVRWFDTYQTDAIVQDWNEAHKAENKKIDWVRCIPLILLHLACFAVFLVGWSWTAVGLAILLYLVRMFAITGFYHRYFSHKTFKTSRFMQFVFGVIGNSSVQRGPLWWAAHHRHHHQFSDEEEDVHSPITNSFLWSHLFWLTTKSNFPTRFKYVGDLSAFPELRFLDRFDQLVPMVFFGAIYLLGEVLHLYAPGLGTTGPQLLVWGIVSTVVLLHGTCTINSLAHLIGRRRFQTKDQSRNSFILALITLGEGWHNNHHHYPASTRQGFYWWEIDITYYGLKVLSWLGLIWDLRPVPDSARNKNRMDQPAMAALASEPTEPLKQERQIC